MFSFTAEGLGVEHCENRPNSGRNPGSTTALANRCVCDGVVAIKDIEGFSLDA